jgi:hypothetical protein
MLPPSEKVWPSTQGAGYTIPETPAAPPGWRFPRKRDFGDRVLRVAALGPDRWFPVTS